jgi:SET domain-containing protein
MNWSFSIYMISLGFMWCIQSLMPICQTCVHEVKHGNLLNIDLCKDLGHPLEGITTQPKLLSLIKFDCSCIL